MAFQGRRSTWRVRDCLNASSIQFLPTRPRPHGRGYHRAQKKRPVELVASICLGQEVCYFFLPFSADLDFPVLGGLIFRPLAESFLVLPPSLVALEPFLSSDFFAPPSVFLVVLFLSSDFFGSDFLFPLFLSSFLPDALGSDFLFVLVLPPFELDDGFFSFFASPPQPVARRATQRSTRHRIRLFMLSSPLGSSLVANTTYFLSVFAGFLSPSFLAPPPPPQPAAITVQSINPQRIHVNFFILKVL